MGFLKIITLFVVPVPKRSATTYVQIRCLFFCRVKQLRIKISLFQISVWEITVWYLHCYTFQGGLPGYLVNVRNKEYKALKDTEKGRPGCLALKI